MDSDDFKKALSKLTSDLRAEADTVRADLRIETERRKKIEAELATAIASRAEYEQATKSLSERLAAAVKELETAKADLADAQARVANMEAHPDVIEAKAAEAEAAKQKRLAEARAIIAEHEKG